MPKITIITASGGKNLELAQKFDEQLKALGAETTILNVLRMDLPLFQAEIDTRTDAKVLLEPWLDTLHTSQAYVILAPEYNGGIPPLLTNFIAWVSRSSKDWRAAFNGKSTVIGTFSSGNGISVLTAMRVQFSILGMNVLGRQIITNSSKSLDEQSLLAVCQQLISHAHL